MEAYRTISGCLKRPFQAANRIWYELVVAERGMESGRGPFFILLPHRSVALE
jgi:hypothetical protein